MAAGAAKGSDVSLTNANLLDVLQEPCDAAMLGDCFQLTVGLLTEASIRWKMEVQDQYQIIEGTSNSYLFQLTKEHIECRDRRLEVLDG